MAFHNSGRIVTNGLVLSLDAADQNSYTSGSTTWFDLSGNGNSGSLANGPIFSSDSGGSIVFDGINDCVSGSVINLQSQMTVLIFAKPIQRTGTNYPVYISKWEAIPSSNRSWQIATNPSIDKELIIVSSNGDYNNSVIKRYEIPSINYNTWRQIGFTFNSGSFIPYRNGVAASYSASLDASITTIHTSSVQYKLGTAFDGAFDINLSGSIANVQIYNRALSAQEVLQNYNAVKSRFNLT
jgi:hypothetical protein